MSDEVEFTGRLENWEVCKLYGVRQVRGAIYDDVRGMFEDGEVIRTTRVRSIKGGILRTKNSVYKLGKKLEKKKPS